MMPSLAELMAAVAESGPRPSPACPTCAGADRGQRERDAHGHGVPVGPVRGEASRRGRLRVSGGVARTAFGADRALAPWDDPLDLDVEREAEERSDEDDQREDEHILERGLYGDRADEGGSHEGLDAEQDPSTEVGPHAAVDLDTRRASSEVSEGSGSGKHEGDEDDRDAD